MSKLPLLYVFLGDGSDFKQLIGTSDTEIEKNPGLFFPKPVSFVHTL